MPKSLAMVSALVAAMTLVMTQACAAGERLDVHEWGTFTSIAGTDGISAGWLALDGPNDLPCFVNRLENNGALKAGLIGTVHMETPVLLLHATGPDDHGVYGGLRARQCLTIKTPPLDGDAVRLRAEIEGRQIDQGLYPSEAKAMVETWRDAWFEEGARLLYLGPRSAVDAVLPLSITPSPDKIVRVFMGRLEVITPATQQAVVRASTNNDAQTLARYARFVAPIVQRIATDRQHIVDQIRLGRLLTIANASSTPRPS